MTGQALTRKQGEQLPLELAYGEATGREDLLVSPAILPAVDLIDRWPDWRAPVVVLVGPPGSGKSHLGNVWRAASGARDFTTDIRAGRGAEPEGRVFLFEDADRHPFDETELFHLINAVRQHRGSLLITARSLPALWHVALPDLRSRLAAATVVEIGAPDDLLLRQIIVKLFSDRQLEVDERVVNYIITRMDRSLDAAGGIVDAMDKRALARGRRITRALAAEVLAEREAG
ncbi:DnaA regulatory inactivator HdaA [Martelella endophytica]|uniref:Hda lid domain-containing protein n=1 Tax=Martelella endophytica TaxID=1486262 RepID=A0A0D5LRQ7_MAREN|nr:DnaA regulatory inactivator HdaA [Martelella endophytica]AJY46033.1 hypothetical protein TM49_10700 [Martelella endophytica]